MLKYKVDWLAFSLSILADNTSGRDDKLMERLGYDLADFDEIPWALVLQLWSNVSELCERVLE